MPQQMDYIALGSSASLPTADRNTPGGILFRESTSTLIDCGEGTTRQILISSHSLHQISSVWLSHSHIDHYLGIAGFLYTLDITSPDHAITIFGNSETIDGVRTLIRLCGLKSIKPQLETVIPGVFHCDDRFQWSAFPLKHTTPALGLAVTELPRRHFDSTKADKLDIPQGPLRGQLASGNAVLLPSGKRIEADEVLGPSIVGRKFVYVSDTAFFPELAQYCHAADLLVCEATYSSREDDLAEKYGHMTARNAATLARDANVAQLVLTHISPRVSSSLIEDEARQIFPTAIVATDLARFRVSNDTHRK